jgi:hypothetical protein
MGGRVNDKVNGVKDSPWVAYVVFCVLHSVWFENFPKESKTEETNIRWAPGILPGDFPERAVTH